MNVPYSMANILDEVDLYVTMECNLNCSFCSVRANEYHNKALPLKRIIELICEAIDLGMQQLHLTGGEPTLRPELEEIICYATKKGVETRLITNGTLLDRNHLSQLQDAGLSNIMVSIDGLEPTHNLLRGSSDAWRKAVDCVQAAVELGICTRMSSVVFQNNIDEIPKLIEIANNLGVHIFSVFLGSPLGRGVIWKNRVVTPTAWRVFLESLLARIPKSEYGSHMEIIAEQGFLWPDTLGFDPTSMKGRGVGCSTLLDDFEYLIIREDGNLYQCVFFLHDGTPIGNVANQSLANALIHAKELSDYAKFIELGNTCSICQWNHLCGGGCRGYSFLYSGDWHQPDPRCAAKENTLPPQYYPLCPIAKLNLRTGRIGGSSEHALSAND